MTAHNNNIAIIIPVYNEEGNIRNVVNDIKKLLPEAEVVVINDGSTDRSAETASQAGAVVLSHPFNLGYGAALQTGYKYALKKGHDAVVQIDGDGQHDPSYITALLRTLKESKADVVIGSRFMGETGYEIPFVRRAGMKLFNFLASVMMKQRITDSTSGYQALNSDILHFYADRRYPVDYPDADVLIMLKRSGFTVREVPVKMYGSDKSMHSGLKPVYYIFKMFLSIFLTIVRKEKFKKEG